jgi:hypothetical protein
MTDILVVNNKGEQRCPGDFELCAENPSSLGIYSKGQRQISSLFFLPCLMIRD